MPVKLLSAREGANFRAGGTNEQGNAFEAGTASGRATCRSCGQRIDKGEAALVGFYDFTHNYGSWTSVRLWIHVQDCTAGEGR